MNKLFVCFSPHLGSSGAATLRFTVACRRLMKSAASPVVNSNHNSTNNNRVRRISPLGVESSAATTGRGGCVNVSDMTTVRSRLLHTGNANQHIARSCWPDVNIPEIPITEYVFRDFDKFGNRPALINGLTGEQYTFIEVKDYVWRIASSLTRLGLGLNDKLLIISENSMEYILMFHAVMCVGGTVTMVNPHYLSSDIARQAVDANASYIFTSKHFISKSQEVATALKNQIKRIFVAGDFPGCVPMSVLMSDDGSALSKDGPSFNPHSHVALLPFSSGTTGLPKGVMLSHYNMVANTAQTDITSDPQIFLEREGTVNLGLLPFYHIFAIVVNFMGALSWGQTTVIIPGFDPQLFIETIQKYKVTLTYAVPPIVLFLNKHPLATQADLSSLKRIICAAAPLPEEMVNELHNKRPHCVVGQAYGMTETSPAVSVNPVGFCGSKPASSGLPLANTLIKIHDSNTGKECDHNETGEVCVYGPQVMLGYLNNKKATDEMIDPEGWLHTGDIGYLDDENHLFVVDRVKELIKFKGLQVPPAELEAILCSHDAVSDAAVIGLPDDDAGELPKAFVALKPGSSATPEELEKYVASRVVSYKRLRGGVSFLRVIPRSPSGKILRKDLKLAAAKSPLTKSAASQ